MDAAVLAAIWERGPELIMLIGADGNVVHVNETLLHTMGYKLADVVGTPVFDYVHPDDIDYMAASWDNRERHPGEPGLIVEGRGRNADGTWRVLEAVGESLLIDDDVGLMVISCRDIANSSALMDSPARLRSMIDRTTDVVFLVSRTGTFTYANRRLTSSFGHDNDRVVGTPWTSILAESDVEAATTWLERLMLGELGATASLRARLVDTSGSEHHIELHGSNQLDDPLIDGVVMTGRQITELIRMEQRLREQNDQLAYAASHDLLTGLVNREAFIAVLADQIHSRQADDDTADVVVLFCDLDGFKVVNDTLGHAAGNEALRVTAGRMQVVVGTDHVVSRYGGDEFTVLFTNGITPARVTSVIARIEAAIAEPFELDGMPVRLGVSVGVSRSPVGTAKVDRLLADADAAMYERKRSRGD